MSVEDSFPVERPRLEVLLSRLLPDAVVLEPSHLDSAIIGEVQGRLVYDYEGLAQSYLSENGGTYEEWLEFVDFNTLRALPYLGETAPLVVTSAEEAFEEEDIEEGEQLVLGEKRFLIVSQMVERRLIPDPSESVS